MYCPFTHRLCTECALYRGRHYYFSLFKQDQKTDETSEHTESNLSHCSVDFQVLKKLADRWIDPATEARGEPQIKLKVIDMESGASRVCDFNEAKTWDWNNQGMMRIIDGQQINSFDRLIEVLYNKAEKGYKEVELYEGPRFMLLAGG